MAKSEWDTSLSKELSQILQRWRTNSKGDLYAATLRKEQDLEMFQVSPKFDYPKEWNEPPFLIPSDEKDAETINDIIKKSWKIQSGRNRHFPGIWVHLISNSCFKICGFLTYYFKRLGDFVTLCSHFSSSSIFTLLGVSDNIRRVIGVMQYTGLQYDRLYPQGAGSSHSFLIIGEDHRIDVAFYEHEMNVSPFKTIMERKKEIQLDEDPGTTEMVIVGVDSVKIEDIGREKLRLVCNPDEKMEQKLAYETTCAFRPRLVIYDLMMRNYIKNKYNVEIPSLAEKWRRLCWNCFNPDDNLQCCSICKIAQYCTKNCQKLDWKIHKELHSMQAEIERSEFSNLFRF